MIKMPVYVYLTDVKYFDSELGYYATQSECSTINEWLFVTKTEIEFEPVTRAEGTRKVVQALNAKLEAEREKFEAKCKEIRTQIAQFEAIEYDSSPNVEERI